MTNDGNQAGRNTQQNQSDAQTSRNQQQDRSDAQTSRNQQQGWSDHNPQSQRNQEQSKTITYNGEVDGFKNVDLKDSEGNSDEQTFIRIRLEEDDARVVSLGSRLIATDLDLEKGDKISVSGRNARIDDEDVLVASTIEVDDKLFRVREKNRPDTDQQDQQSQSGQQGRSGQPGQYGQQGRSGQQSQYGQQGRKSRKRSDQESGSGSFESASRD